jgi:hypothetical protein
MPNTKEEKAIRKRVKKECLIPRILEKYMTARFSDPSKFFYRWNMHDMIKDYKKWCVRFSRIYVYMIVSNSTLHGKLFYVGASMNTVRRLGQHNGRCRGGPSDTRKAMGSWHMAMRIEIPPLTNFSSKTIKKMCRGRGGAQTCILRALEMCARKQLICIIDSYVLDDKSQFYMPLVLEYLETKGRLKSKTPHKDVMLVPSSMFIK